MINRALARTNVAGKRPRAPKGFSAQMHGGAGANGASLGCVFPLKRSSISGYLIFCFLRKG
jgi:hypothetical protein